MATWQQNMSYRKLHELQQQQHLRQRGEARQQNSLNQHSAAAQQAAGGQLPQFINGTPVRGAPHVLMNLMPHAMSPSLQGLPNRHTFPQDQNQTMRSMSIFPQQLHASLHGTPADSAGCNGGQFSNLQEMSRDSASFLSGGNDSQIPIMHSSTFSNSLHRDRSVSADNVTTSEGGFQMKNVFGQVPIPREHFLQMNSSLPEFNERQDLTGNREITHQSTAQLRPSDGLVPLDPLEQKFLYNMDDDGWDTGFGRSLDMGGGGFGSHTVEESDFSGALQSGSWSALMQSAVAEASNSDSGVQEEWSGLTFQNKDLSTNNQPLNFLNEERQASGWADNNLLSASKSKSFPMFNDSSMKSSFPGFQQSDFKSSVHQGDGMRQYDSNELFQKSPKSAGEWLVCNPRQSNQISQQTQPLKHLESAWDSHSYENSESDEQQRRTTSHNNNDQQFSEQKGSVNRTMHRERDLWTGRLEQQNSYTDNFMREDSQAHNLGSVHNTVTVKALHEVDERALESPDYMKHSMNNYENVGGGQFRTIGNISKNDMNSYKECLPNSQGNTKALDDSVYGGDIGSSSSSTFGQKDVFDRHNVALQKSQHMLDLLHKVDRSREGSPMSHFVYTDHNSLSEMPKASTHVDKFERSSTSHGFGLKLSPPSLRFPNPNNSFSPTQDSTTIASNQNPRQVNAESGLKNQGWLDSTSSFRPLAGISSRYAPFNPVSSPDNSQQTPTNPSQPFPNLETALLSQPSNMPSMSQKGGMLVTHQNAWKNVPTSRFPSAVSSINPSKRGIEDTSWSLQGINEKCSRKSRTVSPDLQGSEYGEEQSGEQRSSHEISSDIQDSLQSGSLCVGQETAMKHIPAHSDQKGSASLLGENNGSGVSERSHESYGRSLKASQTLAQNYTLLHQLQGMKNSSETDPSKRVLKRDNDAVDGTRIQQVNDFAMLQSVSEHDLKFRNNMHIGPNSLRTISSPSGDSKLLSFLSNAREELSGKLLSQPTSQPSQGIDKFNQNEQILLTYDAIPEKIAIEQFSAAKPCEPMPINTSCLGNQRGDTIRTKKRKTITAEIIPWHIEVARGSHRLQDISMAEQDWACTTYNLVEKVEDDTELIGEGQPMHHRSKKRLILTTQLMQQLLRPAPASILLGDASSQRDSVVYFVSKLAVGDGCSLINCSTNESHATSGDRDMTSENDKHLVTVMEGFAERSKKLEKDFSRFESSFVLDIRLDYQDLERNFVINRFAKFHMRGQTIPSGPSNSGTAMTVLRPAPQKYVTVFPMPTDLPKETQCYSL